MKLEFSAGGIVLRQAQDKSTKKPKLEVLVVQHSAHHGWVFPKGLIDSGETKETTALREVKEEGGIEAKIVKELPPTEYFYQFKGEKIKKKVTYFLMEYISGDIANHDWEMETAEWVRAEEVEEKLSFKSDKEVFKKAKELLEKI